MLKIISTNRLDKIESELECAKEERDIVEVKYYEKNNVLRKIHSMLQEFETRNTFGLAGYRDLIRRIKDEVNENTELTFGDEIFRR